MISPRFGIVVSVLMALALVPTVIHNYVGAITTDGLVTTAIDPAISEFSSEPTARRASWVKQTFATDDWIERRYTAPDGESVLLFVARSHDIKRLYHHPEIGVLRGVDLENKGIIRLSETNHAPVHLLGGRRGRGLAAYVLLYDEEFVGNPIALQLRTSLELLLSPRKSMTLFLAYQENVPSSAASFDTSHAGRVLSGAIASFLSQNPKAPSQ